MKSKKKLFLQFSLFLLALFATDLTAQPEILWTRQFGGDRSESCSGVYVLEDGSIVIGGQTNSFGNGEADLYLIKTDEEGEEIWSRTYGDENSQQCRSFILTEDGGFSFAGDNLPDVLNRDDYQGPITLTKIEADGDELWSRSYDIGSFCLDHVQTEDDGFAILGGSLRDESFLMKTVSNGEEDWIHIFSPDLLYYLRSMVYVETDEYPYYQFIIAGGVFAVEIGGFLKIFSYGGRPWRNLFYLGTRYQPVRLIQTRNGEYVLCGDLSNRLESPSLCLIKISNDGETQWLRTYEFDIRSYCKDISETPEGDYLIAGYSRPIDQRNVFNLFLTKVSSNGDQIWLQNYDVPARFDVYCDIAPDGGYIIAARAPGQDLFLIKTTPDNVGIKSPASIILPNNFMVTSVYPNPFNSKTAITYRVAKSGNLMIDILDYLGRPVKSLFNGYVQPGIYKEMWVAENVPSGVYFCRMTCGENEERREIVLIR